MKKDLDSYIQLAKEDWYAQSCNSTPFTITSAGLSAFSLQSKIGFSYTKLMYEFQNDFGQIEYYVDDLKRLSTLVITELKKDPRYFSRLKEKYDEEQKLVQVFFARVHATDLSQVPEQDLYDYIKKGMYGIETAVGIGHIIEPYALIADSEVKAELGTIITDPMRLNEAYITLTAPVDISFLQRAEEDLKKIALMQDKKALIKKYKEDFYWIRNSYSARHILQDNEIIEEAEAVKNKQPVDVERVKKSKEQLFAQYTLPPFLKLELEVMAFLASWQDERKQNILMGIDCVEQIFEEVSRRTGVPIEILRYARLEEVTPSVATISDELASRRKGSYYFQDKDGVVVFSKKDFEKIRAGRSKTEMSEIKQLNGSAASLGSAIGKVKVCTTIESLKKVQEGDILVASMTRPEYLPAMKKAAAFVTDEGGITCHAAIVAREMQKPCVIGTKNATKVLKDNDIVEVKGRHGVVIIRERAI